MRVLVIDGQGGKIGKMVIEKLVAADYKGELIAVGTNAIATAAMLRAGARQGATGENPVTVNAEEADVIVGPMGIVSANALWGEITPKMVMAISKSRAQKVLIPVNQCRIAVAGTEGFSIGDCVDKAVEFVLRMQTLE